MDVAGFLAPLTAAYGGPVDGTRASVLGAGGAARAVVVALASQGARVTVHARRTEQARQVADLVGCAIGEWPPGPDSWDLLVNCTPLGGVNDPDASPMPGGPFRGRLVYDLIYRPAETRLLREAGRAGCATLNGLPMLIAQAERQFEWWTGRAPRPGAMRTAIETMLDAGGGPAPAEPPPPRQRLSGAPRAPEHPVRQGWRCRSPRSRNSRSWRSAARSCPCTRRLSRTS